MSMVISLRKKRKIIIGLILTMLIIAFAIDNSTTILKRVYPVKYSEYVLKYSKQYEVDPYLTFAVIKAESSFNPKAVSHKEAIGLMQLTRQTAVWGAESIGIEDFETSDLFDAETNIRIGCWYLSWLMKELKNTDLVIAAYNGGIGNVKKWLQDSNLSNSGDSLDRIPFAETDRFLKRVKNYYWIYKRLYAGKF
jgi:soluble lytic murein transglycosylase